MIVHLELLVNTITTVQMATQSWRRLKLLQDFHVIAHTSTISLNDSKRRLMIRFRGKVSAALLLFWELSSWLQVWKATINEEEDVVLLKCCSSTKLLADGPVRGKISLWWGVIKRWKKCYVWRTKISQCSCAPCGWSLRMAGRNR